MHGYTVCRCVLFEMNQTRGSIVDTVVLLNSNS